MRTADRKSSRCRLLLLVPVLVLVLSACSAAHKPAPKPAELQTQEQTTQTGDTEMKSTLQLTINDTPVAVLWEDNAAVQSLNALAAKKPLTVPLSMYGGFEQVGSLGTTLPRSDRQITTSAGDIMLYAGNQIVLFYGSNTWSYTRLGKITGLTQAQLTALLENSNVTVTLAADG